METIQQQIGALQLIVAKQQVSVKRQRFAIIALAAIIVAGGFIAAVRPVGDATFDTITCKGWDVVDSAGKVRITAYASTELVAGVTWLDKNGKQRITVDTSADGTASVALRDQKYTKRIIAKTESDNSAGVQWFDESGKLRIMSATMSIKEKLYAFLPTDDMDTK